EKRRNPLYIHRGIRGEARRAAGVFAALLLLLSVRPVAGQGTDPEAARGGADVRAGTIRGVVVSAETGAPLPQARVYVDRTNLGATSDARGAFHLTGVAPGAHVLVAELIGHRTERVAVRVEPGRVVDVEVRLTEEALPLPGVVVSTTREAERLSSTAATVGVVEGAALRDRRPAHPSEVLGDIPGVWVNVTGGEGHMTAIRQPLTTDPVYLYLEDGVPTRSTGFFNHNALYEINLPQADRVEVVKGPATAL